MFFFVVYFFQVSGASEEKINEFWSKNSFVSGAYDRDEDLRKLQDHINAHYGADTNRVYYLAVPPTVYESLTKCIKHECMHSGFVFYIFFLNSFWFYFLFFINICSTCRSGRRAGRALWSRSRSAGTSTARTGCRSTWALCSARTRSTASTTISAKRWSRRCCSSGTLTLYAPALCTACFLWSPVVSLPPYPIRSDALSSPPRRRFGNRLFWPLWTREHISAVVISFKEPFGTQGRGGYFDEFGMIRCAALRFAWAPPPPRDHSINIRYTVNCTQLSVCISSRIASSRLSIIF